MTKEQETELVCLLEAWGRFSQERVRPRYASLALDYENECDEVDAGACKSMSTLRPINRHDVECIDRLWNEMPLGPEKCFLQVVYALRVRNVGKAAHCLGITRKRYFILRKRSHLLLWSMMQ